MTRARDNANNWAADITGVTAGTGITGGGTSGTVTVTNEMVTTIDAKGDLIVGSGADTFVRVPVGGNNQVLAADSATTSGVKWTTVDSSPTVISARVASDSAGGTYTITNSFASGVYDINTSGTLNNVVLGGISANATGTYYTSTTASSATFVAFGRWTSRAVNDIGGVYSVTYGTVYVAAGYNGNLSTSTDAITWTTRNANWGAPTTDTILALVYGNNLYVAGGENGKLTTSTDAITWTTRTSQFGGTTIRGLVYGNSVYVAVGSSGTIRSSTDAITWTTRLTGLGLDFNGITYGNNLYVTGGQSGVLLTSTDAITWTTRTSGFGTSAIEAFGFGNGIYLAGGASGKLTTSTNGTTWTARTANLGTQSITAIIYDGSRYLAATSNGALSVSTDAITWSTRAASTAAIKTLLYANNLYVGAMNGVSAVVTATSPEGTVNSDVLITIAPTKAITPTL